MPAEQRISEEKISRAKKINKKFDFMNHGQPSQKVFIHLSIYSFIHSCLISGQWFWEPHYEKGS